MRRKAPKLFAPALLSIALLLPLGHGCGRGDEHARRSVQRIAGRRPHARRLRRRPPHTAPAAADSKRVPFGRAEMQLSFAPLVKDYRSGRRQCLRLAECAGALAIRRRSVLRAVLRRSADAAAGAAVAGLRRAGRCFGHGRHQFPRDPECRHREGRDRRRPRIREQAAPEGRVARPRRAQDRIAGAVSGDPGRQFRRARGRRPRARHRRSVRRRADDDQRHRLGAGALEQRHFRLRLLHPDRRGDQSGQFRRRADQHARRAGRHQQLDLQPQRRLDRHRLRDPLQYGARGHRVRRRTATTSSSGPISEQPSRR